MSLIYWIERIEKGGVWFVLFISSIFTLLRLPSLFEPYWYGDEGIYQVIGVALRHSRLLYRDIWDNKPPLLYLVYALFSSDQFAVRFASLLFGIGAVVAFFLLAKKLFTDKKHIYIMTAVFAVVFGTPLIEGNIANAENFMLFPILLAGLLVWKYSKKENAMFLAFAGFLLSIAFLFKVVAVFDTAAFFLFLVFMLYHNINSIPAYIKKLVPFITAFAVPIITTGFILFLQGGFQDFLRASFTQNVGYVGWGNTFLFPNSLLVFKLIILAAFCYYLFLKRKNTTPMRLFILLWVAFSTFDAFFSQRPYTHYLLMLLPSYILLSGLILSQKRTKIAYALFGTITLALLISFKVYAKTPLYYVNFLSFITNLKSVDSYRAFFDGNTPNDYNLTQFIKTHTTSTDNVYIWGNNAQVYKLSDKLPPGRYTVAYHAASNQQSLDETKQAVVKANPKYIVVTSPNNIFPFSLSSYQQRYMIGQSIIYERVH